MINVSVIVPVYNTSQYLEKCLESLVNQTLVDIEIICIDDGSTDSSPQILKEFAQNDSRIKILTQKNKGLSGARNSGMKIAIGEYIGFLDSDDWADEKMFEQLYNNAKKFNSDISMCSIKVYDDRSGEIDLNDPYLTLDLYDESFDNRAFNYRDVLNFIFRVCVTSWHKIYRRKFLESKNLRFVEGLYFEDNIFNLQTFVEAERISLIRDKLIYYRRFTDNSCTFGKNDDKKLDFFKIFELEEEYLKQKGLYNKLEEYFKQTKKNTLIYWYKKLNDEKVKSLYLKELEKLYPTGVFN